ncbi:hypothetical protein N8194_01340 [Akkermansiaceae bacterium]|nr:hypothetical protein [Akkermansiaceae bacterium]
MIAAFAVVVYFLQALFQGTAIPWQPLSMKVMGAFTIVLVLPIFLRFGGNFFTIFGMILFVSMFGSLDILIRDVLKTDPAKLEFLALPAFAILLLIVWAATYRTLGSTHPWRANRLAMGFFKHGR